MQNERDAILKEMRNSTVIYYILLTKQY